MNLLNFGIYAELVVRVWSFDPGGHMIDDQLMKWQYMNMSECSRTLSETVTMEFDEDGRFGYPDRETEGYKQLVSITCNYMEKEDN